MIAPVFVSGLCVTDPLYDLLFHLFIVPYPLAVRLFHILPDGQQEKQSAWTTP